MPIQQGPTHLTSGFNANQHEHVVRIKNTTHKKTKAAHHPVKKAHVAKRLHKITHGRHRHHH
jgi:hypothetical protein